MHDLILVLCSLLIYVAIIGGCSRIANSVSGFSVTITPIKEKKTESIVEAQQHG